MTFRLTRKRLLPMLGLALVLAAGGVQADPVFLMKRDRYAQSAQSGGVTRAEAARIARQRTGGKVLSVRRQGNQWKVKVLLRNERVRIVTVSATTRNARN